MIHRAALTLPTGQCIRKGETAIIFPLDKNMESRHYPITGKVVTLFETTDFGYCVLEIDDIRHIYKLS